MYADDVNLQREEVLKEAAFGNGFYRCLLSIYLSFRGFLNGWESLTAYSVLSFALKICFMLRSLLGREQVK